MVAEYTKREGIHAWCISVFSKQKSDEENGKDQKRLQTWFHLDIYEDKDEKKNYFNAKFWIIDSVIHMFLTVIITLNKHERT